MDRLTFKWTVSRGRETYGYNICSLWVNGQKASSCNGGGYDMKGTALADWLQDEYQDKLIFMLGRKAHGYMECNEKGEYIGRFTDESIAAFISAPENERFYGMTAYVHKDGNNWTVRRIVLDGGCGFSSIERIMEAIGLGLQYVAEDKKNTSYILAPAKAIAALHGIKG